MVAPPCLVAVLLGVLWFQPPTSTTSSPATENPSTTPPVEALARGRELYHHHCSTCHGSEGRGDGPAARFMNPAPLNFHGSRAENLTDEQMTRVIAEGKPRTGMPAWKGRLSRQEIRWLVDYLREEFVRSDGADSPAASPGPTESGGRPSS